MTTPPPPVEESLPGLSAGVNGEAPQIQVNQALVIQALSKRIGDMAAEIALKDAAIEALSDQVREMRVQFDVLSESVSSGDSTPSEGE